MTRQFMEDEEANAQLCKQGIKGFVDCIESIGAKQVSVTFYSSDVSNDGQNKQFKINLLMSLTEESMKK